MASRPGSRTDSSWHLLVLALVVLAPIAGCGEEQVRRPVRMPDEPVDGYAYTAMLVSRHPLWRAVREMEDALEELGDDEWDPVLEPGDDRFADIAFIESFALADPEPQMVALRRAWRADYPPLLLQAEGLSRDLEVGIEWERRQADRMVAKRMAQARSAESRRLAQMRAALFEKYQERLTNLSIEASIRREEAAAAARAERKRVLEVIETEMAAAREAGGDDLAGLEAELRRQAALCVRQTQERADTISERRGETVRAAGSDLYDQMIEQMRRPWPMPEIGEASVEEEAAPANRRLHEMSVSREAAEDARREKVREQREQVAEALGRLRAQIKAGTETAAKVVAYRNGIRLQVIPGGRRQGDDVTRLIADELDDFWSVGGSQRS